MKKGSEFILWFSDINMNSLPRVGGKAASLGEMFNFKLPIPNGFCVTADAYKFFLEQTKIKKITKSFGLKSPFLDEDSDSPNSE